MTCPECGYEAEDGKEWEYRFCPSYPDGCEGCEIDTHKRECPECGREFDVIE